MNYLIVPLNCQMFTTDLTDCQAEIQLVNKQDKTLYEVRLCTVKNPTFQHYNVLFTLEKLGATRKALTSFWQASHQVKKAGGEYYFDIDANGDVKYSVLPNPSEPAAPKEQE